MILLNLRTVKRGEVTSSNATSVLDGRRRSWTGGNERLAEQHANVGNKIARSRMVCAIQDQIVLGYNLFRVGGCEVSYMRNVRRKRVEPDKGLAEKPLSDGL